MFDLARLFVVDLLFRPLVLLDLDNVLLDFWESADLIDARSLLRINVQQASHKGFHLLRVMRRDLWILAIDLLISKHD